ncbi:unnamed protein product, partial [Staurois parvus]
MAVHSRAMQSSVLTVKQEHSPVCKTAHNTQLTLCSPHVNPFLPSAISTVSVLFISSDHCIGVTGMSVTASQFPPVSECLPQSC